MNVSCGLSYCLYSWVFRFCFIFRSEALEQCFMWKELALGVLLETPASPPDYTLEVAMLFRSVCTLNTSRQRQNTLLLLNEVSVTTQMWNCLQPIKCVHYFVSWVIEQEWCVVVSTITGPLWDSNPQPWCYKCHQDITVIVLYFM